MNRIEIDIQIESTHEGIPESSELVKWTTAALKAKTAEITIRIVDEEESAQLNHTYRNKEGPTNVLSFPMTSPHDQKLLLGDLIICAPIVFKESLEQEKNCQDHWAHMVIHGVLHLQGYDHIDETDAKKMQAKEIKLLSTFGVANPYDD